MTVENLNITVKTNADKAAPKLESLASAIDKLEVSVSKMAGLSNLANLASAVAQLSTSKVSVSIFNSMAKGIERLSEALATITEGDIVNLTMISDALAKLNGVNLLGVAGAARVVGKETNKAANGIKEVGDAAKKSEKPLGNFLSSLKRIAFYRIIRGIIKSITQAFQEGLEKAYLFSQGVSGEGNRFAAAMDRMKSAGNQMKGQLGSAFISLLAAVEPILITLINLVTKVADAMSQLLAAFTGKTYLKANATTAQFVDNMKSGGRAAKEWKNQLLGFDEINRLNEPSSGGGGGGTNPLDGFDFDDTPLDEWAQKLHDILANLTLSFDNIFFKWENLTPEDIAQKVITGLTAVAGGIIGFALGGPGGAALGMTIGAGLGVVISSLIFNNDGKIDENEFVGMIIAAMGGIGGAIIGFSIGGVAGAALGFILGVSISLVLQKMNWLNPVKGQSAEVVQEYLDGVKESFDAATPGTYEASYFDRWKRYAERQMQEAGKASADGFDEGVEGEFTVLGWLESVWERIKNNVRTSFGIHSPSTVFEGFGNNIVQGLWNGLSQTWGQMESWWSRLSLPEFHIPRPHFDWTYTEASGLIAEALKFVGLPATIPHLNISWYAQGGFPTEGQLFFANEAGPELVGTMGGRSAVANQQEIVEGIRQGVYEAVVAGNNNGGGDVQVRVYLDSREIKAGQQRLNRAWGV